MAAISRYDQRKGARAGEATPSARCISRRPMPESVSPDARSALKRYLDLRIQYYLIADQAELARVGAERAKVEADLWASARALAAAAPTPYRRLSPRA